MGPAVSVPSWNKLTLSPARLVLATSMRQTSVDIPAFLGVRCRFNNNPRDRNTIASSEFLSDSLFFSFIHSFTSATIKPPLFPPATAAYTLASWARIVWHHGCRVFTWHVLPRRPRPPTLVTLESTSPLLPNAVRSPSSVWGQVPPVVPQRRLTGPGHSWDTRPGSAGVRRK